MTCVTARPAVIVIVGLGAWLAVTVRVAALLVTEPPALVTTTRNMAPLSVVWTLLRVSVEEVAPLMLAKAPPGRRSVAIRLISGRITASPSGPAKSAPVGSCSVTSGGRAARDTDGMYGGLVSTTSKRRSPGSS